MKLRACLHIGKSADNMPNTSFTNFSSSSSLRFRTTTGRRTLRDNFLAEATPEAKMDLTRREQQSGKLVVMTGDGTNDRLQQRLRQRIGLRRPATTSMLLAGRWGR
jgi:hypothetical protein